jgi:L-asparaginase/Glu-tRNA(Gln) amidotransferase subunit D
MNENEKTENTEKIIEVNNEETGKKRKIEGLNLENIEINTKKKKKLIETITILMIYTGGTIGMKENEQGTYSPSSGHLQQLLKELSAFHDVDAEPLKYELTSPTSKYNKRANYTILEFDPLLDSTNMTCTEWNKIAKTIEENYEKFDSFIIIHGTDTMSYTASALSFMFSNLNKTIIITGKTKIKERITNTHCKKKKI